MQPIARTKLSPCQHLDMDWIRLWDPKHLTTTPPTSRESYRLLKKWSSSWPMSSSTTRRRCRCLDQKKKPWSQSWPWRPKTWGRLSPTRTLRLRRRWRGTMPIRRQKIREYNSRSQPWRVRRPHLTCSCWSWRGEWPSLNSKWVLLREWNELKRINN